MSDYLNRIKTLLDCIEFTDYIGKRSEYEEGVSRVVGRLRECKAERGSLFLCGNGGSAGIAQHMAADFLKNAGVRIHDLFGQTTITCISNDLGYEHVFCRQLELMADSRDILIAISSSGESENIISAIETMRMYGGYIVTLTGFQRENRIRKMGDMNIYVPVCHYGITESIHNLILQHCVDLMVDLDSTDQ